MRVRRVVPVLTVADIEEARTLYTQVLGMDVVMDHGWILTLADPGDRHTQLSLMTRDLTAPCNPSVSVEVDDLEGLDEAHRLAGDSGAEIVHPLSDEEWGVRRFFLRDATGNVVNVLAHR